MNKGAGLTISVVRVAVAAVVVTGCGRTWRQPPTAMQPGRQRASRTGQERKTALLP